MAGMLLQSERWFTFTAPHPRCGHDVDWVVDRRRDDPLAVPGTCPQCHLEVGVAVMEDQITEQRRPVMTQPVPEPEDLPMGPVDTGSHPGDGPDPDQTPTYLEVEVDLPTPEDEEL